MAETTEDGGDPRVHAAELVLEFDSPETAGLVADAVRQEVGEIDGDRSRADVTREEDVVRVDVGADDLAALRAGLNTWSSLVAVAERTADPGR